MAKQKTLAKPYEIIREDDYWKERRKPLRSIDKAKQVILDAIEGLEEPPKPVKWWKPIKESFKPIEEQKDSSAARLAFTLNPMLRMNIAIKQEKILYNY